MRIPATLLLAALLAACTPGSDTEVETMRIAEADLTFSLFARGELRAAESTPILPPGGSRNPRTIAWMAPNFSAVEAGEVIVRFDVTDAERGALEAGVEISKVDLDVGARAREMARLMEQIGGELDIVDIERSMADELAVEDTLAYSRMQIIDARRDRDLLDYRAEHLEEQKDIAGDRQDAELAVLDAQRSTQQSQSETYERLVALSEVRAPHDGFIVYEKNWWGQEIEVGTTVFPGNRIARIPNLDRMEAVLLAQETEAVGLAPGQEAVVVIDAYPDRPLTGTVTNVSATATSIERDNPVKYFTVIVSLDQADPEWIKPGIPVEAGIRISHAEDAIAVPNQALFQGDDEDWVLARVNGRFEQRKVKLGLRGANRSQVVDGLSPGDEIALYPPREDGG